MSTAPSPDATRAPLGHWVLLGIAVALPLAWMLVRGEPAKTLVQVVAFTFAVVALLAASGARKSRLRWLPWIAALLAFGGCASTCQLFYRDLPATQAEIDAFTCADAQQVIAHGRAIGRNWSLENASIPRWRSHASRPWRYADLYLSPLDAPDHGFSLSAGAWTNDTVYGSIDCTTGARENFATDHPDANIRE